MRNAFINTLFQLAKKDKNIFLLNGDLGFSVLEEFNKTYPTRAWNMGVAEADGHNLRQLQTLLQKVPFEKEKPSLIVAHTVKGKGVSFMENKLEWHYRTPSEAEAEMAIKEIENL